MGQPTEGDGILAAALIEDAVAHESEAFDRIATRYDDVYGELLPIQDLGVRRFVVAFHFWDAWCDARNHEWRYYPGVAPADWPRLARHIAENLRRGEDATDTMVLENFSPEVFRSRRIKFRDWVRNLWKRPA
jgi:hypothetical protein